MCSSSKMLLTIFSVILLLSPFALADDASYFYPGGSHDTGIISPAEFLGHPLAERASKYEEVKAYFTALAAESSRMILVEDGESHEGRPMFYAIISSEKNMSRLNTIKSDIQKLADPRLVESASEAESLALETPAITWILYTIHGNEVSGTESSLQCAWQLVAGNDETTRKIRDELVVCLYPMQNPDGRERYLNQVFQWNGPVANNDYQSMQLAGDWPPTRGNHYLFDLNRDWFLLAHPESRARVKALIEWMPQLVIDAHEMGSYDTYLFSPPREPINTHINRSIRKWWRVFADEQAQAFNSYGWSYYTGEWNESWYPGYTTSWTSCLGAVSILYEQALTGGTQVKRPDGAVLTFREAVHHQFVSSMANLKTAANNRRALLSDFHAMKKESLTSAAKAKVKAYIVDPSKNPTRAANLMEKLAFQGIEIGRASEEFTLSKVRDAWSEKPAKTTFPAGSYVIRLDQPLRPLAEAILEFDPRLSTEVLKDERDSLEKGRGSKMYEVSTWSLFLAFDVDAYESYSLPDLTTEPFQGMVDTQLKIENSRPGFGYLLDYNDDSAVLALFRLHAKDYNVRSAIKPFVLGGKKYDRGTLLIRLNENPAEIVDDVAAIARETGVSVLGIDTALSDSGPDLGGRQFRLLVKPKIAMIAGPSISSYSFGSMWYHLEQDLGYRCSLLYESHFSWRDLRKYNVIILPSGSYNSLLGKAERLKDWVRDGGTLITAGSASVYVADKDRGFSKVRILRQSLEDNDLYSRALTREDNAGKSVVDSLSVWGISDTKKPSDDKNGEDAEKPKKLSKEEREELDSARRLFRPFGAYVNAALDAEHWLSFGIGTRMPALLGSSYAFRAKSPVETVARLSDASSIRVSGLFWPEARERWSRSAYATRESMGRGQVILFAEEPFFRAYNYGTARLLDNAIALGPGFGSSQPVDW